MEATLLASLSMSMAFEELEDGGPEERAAFGLFLIDSSFGSITEGFDHYLKGVRAGPLVSGYHVAEWLAWNWWRLRCEPKSRAKDWFTVHSMAAIGEGYLWPNIEIFSDGERTALVSKKSLRSDAKPFRFLGAKAVVIPTPEFEEAVDGFLAQVLGRLEQQGLRNTNLSVLWNDLREERRLPEIATRRRLEALLGRDPDAVEDETIGNLLADTAKLGETARDEIAANYAQSTPGHDVPLRASEFERLAEAKGHDASPGAGVSLSGGVPQASGSQVPAWRVGVTTARSLREQERLGCEPLSGKQLADMLGTLPECLTDTSSASKNLSFALDGTREASKIVLRSAWPESRRFDLARLLGDRLLREAEPLYPATRTGTYRQKMQRAFAAELLSPFEAVDAMLDGDYSEEAQEEVAEHYEVSSRTIETLLMNNGRIEPREEFDVLAV